VAEVPCRLPAAAGSPLLVEYLPPSSRTLARFWSNISRYYSNTSSNTHRLLVEFTPLLVKFYAGRLGTRTQNDNSMYGTCWLRAVAGRGRGSWRGQRLDDSDDRISTAELDIPGFCTIAGRPAAWSKDQVASRRQAAPQLQSTKTRLGRSRYHDYTATRPYCRGLRHQSQTCSGDRAPGRKSCRLRQCPSLTRSQHLSNCSRGPAARIRVIASRILRLIPSLHSHRPSVGAARVLATRPDAAFSPSQSRPFQSGPLLFHFVEQLAVLAACLANCLTTETPAGSTVQHRTQGRFLFGQWSCLRREETGEIRPGWVWGVAVGVGHQSVVCVLWLIRIYKLGCLVHK
jgi:hypothetical protein